MKKSIRSQINEIFNKIQKSLKKQSATTDTTKLVDRRSESRYHTVNK